MTWCPSPARDGVGTFGRGVKVYPLGSGRPSSSSTRVVALGALVQMLVSRGFRVIRFDNRDVGMSTWMEGEYALDDMAADATALLDALGIPAAHIVGASMGGFIAQLVALNHPEQLCAGGDKCSQFRWRKLAERRRRIDCGDELRRDWTIRLLRAAFTLRAGAR